MRAQQLQILVIEDNPADVRLLQECLKQVQAPWIISLAEDGDRALAKLASGGPLPDLILLDLNLPRKSGHEVLRELKADPVLRAIPVIILSSSQAPADVNAAYKGYANCYVSKPAHLDQYVEIVQLVEDFWHQRAELPSPLST